MLTCGLNFSIEIFFYIEKSNFELFIFNKSCCLLFVSRLTIFCYSQLDQDNKLIPKFPKNICFYQRIRFKLVF